ncbi:DoxX family protein [Spirillospora sp. NPDC047279]|uniref:DoxX family protein n=1 Tax=Spirillospora sp. NPDC047279 TaxID=3155478 RepID=UPI0033FB4EB0
MSSVTKGRLLVGLCVFVALEYAFGGVAKFWEGTGPFGQDYAVRFVEWGYPSWFRYVVGAGELVAAGLLIVPRGHVRFLGAALLVVIMIGASITHIANQDPLWQSISAYVHLSITVVLAWALRTAGRDEPAVVPREPVRR